MGTNRYLALPLAVLLGSIGTSMAEEYVPAPDHIRSVDELFAEALEIHTVLVTSANGDGCKTTRINGMVTYSGTVQKTYRGQNSERITFCGFSGIAINRIYVLAVEANAVSGQRVVSPDGIFIEQLPGEFYRQLSYESNERKVDGKDVLILGLKQTGLSSSLAAISNASENVFLVSGTYAIEICEAKACQATEAFRKIVGFLVIDESRRQFDEVSAELKSVVNRDTYGDGANYCYYFPKETVGKIGTPVQEDSVGFGNSQRHANGKLTVRFLVDSPDFRFLTELVPHGNGFIGNWKTHYAGNGGVETDYQSAQFIAEKIDDADAGICFEASKKLEPPR